MRLRRRRTPVAEDRAAEPKKTRRWRTPADESRAAEPKKARRRRTPAGESGATEPKKTRRRKRRLPRLAKDRHVEAFGIAFISFGFLVTALTWSGMRTATNVAYQLPLLASGGLVAIGCYIVGGLLLVGGIVMTRFARLEKDRRPPVETEAELRLFDEKAERRESVSS